MCILDRQTGRYWASILVTVVQLGWLWKMDVYIILMVVSCA